MGSDPVKALFWAPLFYPAHQALINPFTIAAPPGDCKREHQPTRICSSCGGDCAYSDGEWEKENPTGAGL